MGHHIISYIQIALNYLNDRKMTEEGLRIVMEKGHEHRRQYYRERTEYLRYNEFMGLVKLFQHVSLEIGLTEAVIQQAIDQDGFRRSLSKGVLYKKGLRYTIPIPSLRDYMVREWLIEKELAAKEQALTKELPKADPEKEFLQKEPENIQQTAPPPKKRRGRIHDIQIRERQTDLDTLESRDTSSKDQGTDIGMER